jgi:hypothetical protein
MTIQLLPRSVRAMADQINAYYRVWKGIDADSLALRLSSGGTFEIRHSVTNAPVLTVNDSGANVTPVIPAGSITTTQIADGTIVDIDISPGASIDAVKLRDATVLLAKMAPNSVDSSKIVDGSIVNADINAAAAIAGSKLADGSITGLKIMASEINSAHLQDGTIQGADVGSAQLTAVKLNGGGTANRLFATTDGTTVTMQQVGDALVATGAGIALSKLLAGAAGVLKSNGSVITAGNAIVSADIADGTIVDADINASANINGAKLADGSVTSAKLAGASVPPGSITTTEIANNTIVDADINAAANINGAKLLDNSVPSSKLITGAPITPGSITTTEIADGTIMNVDINAAAAIGYGKLNLANSIVTGDIAANAVSVRVAAATGTTTPSTTNTAMAVLADPKVTITTTAISDIYVWFNSVFNDGSGNSLVAYALRIDGGAWQSLGDTSQPNNQGRWFMAGFHAFLNVAAGVHTIECGNGNNAAYTIMHFAQSRRLMALAVAR